MKTLILSSSLAAKSNSFVLCKEIEDRLKKAGHKVVFIDAREMDIVPSNKPKTESMLHLAKEIEKADNFVIGTGIHNYSISDALKMLLDTCFKGGTGKFYGMLCAAGGQKSYLAWMDLAQCLMNQYRMIQLPRVIYATKENFENEKVVSEDVQNRLDTFAEEFITIGMKLLS